MSHWAGAGAVDCSASSLEYLCKRIDEILQGKMGRLFFGNKREASKESDFVKG